MMMKFFRHQPLLDQVKSMDVCAETGFKNRGLVGTFRNRTIGNSNNSEKGVN
ncbi:MULTISPECIES: hypothetical protein [Rhodonellum]|nr:MULTISPECIES: hypothetical protein [Rhodonellum]